MTSEHQPHLPPPAASDGAAPFLSVDQSAHLGTIIDSAMDGIITLDQSQRVIMFNRAAQQIFGVSGPDAIGSPIERFIPDRFRTVHSHHIEAFASTGATVRSMGRLGTIFGLRADGKEFPIEASISHTTVGGSRYFTIILRDVSDKIRLEGQLLQAQKMESIGRLAGGIAHDFNNLLMAMFNYLSLASRRLEPDHAARPYLAHTQEVAERAAGLTRQLLAFARKQTLRPRILNPRDVVAGVEPMLRRMVGEDITLHSVLSPDTGNVIADASQLEQVLVNLAVNARDAMPKGGTLIIQTCNVTLGEDYCGGRINVTPGEHVLISVADSGEGMPPEVLARLFEPFFTTKAAGKGTGLGLATCHGIVTQHGGQIDITSELGRGTTVKIYLPRAKERTAAPATTAAAPAPLGGTETVLLAEDSKVICDLAAAAMREVGYTVLAAPDGQSALALAAAHPGPIHLLVTDAVMPGMSGSELAATILRLHPNARVIFISGYTPDAIEPHGLPPHAAAFLAKPFMTDVLLAKIREVLGSPRK